MPDALIPGLPDTTPPAKGMSVGKTLLVCFFSVLAVFLIWLFYPAKPPALALRGCLPDACLVTGEIHAPDAFSSGLVERAFGSRFQRLPAYPHLERLLQQQGFALGATPDLARCLGSLASSTLGMRNCTALAFGATADPQPQIAMIFAVDNLGLLLLKAGGWFLPAAAGGGCRKIPVRDLVGDGVDVPDFYLTGVPGTRYFLLATAPEMFKHYKISAPDTPASLFPQAPEQAAAELTVRLDGETMALARGLLPGRAGMPDATGGMNGEMFFRWDYEMFRGKIRMRVPDAAPAAPARRLQIFSTRDRRGETAETPAPAAVLPAPPAAGAPGLAAACAFPREMADADLLRQLLSLSPAGTAPAAALEAFLPGLRQIQKNLGGGFYLQLKKTAPGQKDLTGMLSWTVDDPEAAADNLAKGLKNIFAAAAPRQEGGLLGLLTPAALLRVKKSPGRLKISVPLLPPLYAGFSGTAPDGRATLGTAWPLPEPPQLVPCPPQTLAAARFTWRHTPEMASVLAGGGGTVWTALNRGLKIFSAGDAVLQPVEDAFRVGTDVLCSLQALDVEFRNDIDAVHGGTEASLEFSGVLRLPEISGPARAPRP